MRRLLSFLVASLLLALAPGPDNCFVLAQSAAYGAPAGLAVTLGLISGLCVHITLAVLGLAALLTRFPRLATFISALGALYLLWVACGMWHAGLAPAQATQASLLGFYLKGILLNLSNPKVILFFLAFLPKFLPSPCPCRALGLLRLGALFALCAGAVMSAFALFGGLLSRLLSQTPAIALWTGRAAALAVLAIAVWILLPLLPKRRTPPPSAPRA